MAEVFKINFISLLVVLSNSIFSQAQMASVAGDSCKLYQQEFSVDTSTYKDFNEPLSDFFLSEYQFDLLFIKMVGGNHLESELKRWFIKDQYAYMISMTHEKKEINLIDLDNEKILDLVETIQSGDYMQLCPYSTSNDSYLVLIKANSVLKFKYTSTDKYYQSLHITERNEIINVVNLLAYLNSKPE